MNEEDRKKAASTLAKIRWSKRTPEERKAHSVKMNEARRKKLSTDDTSQ